LSGDPPIDGVAQSLAGRPDEAAARAGVDLAVGGIIVDRLVSVSSVDGS
jgi:hypothetical protein